MKKLTIAACAVLLLLSCNTLAQMPDSATMMKNMQTYMTPGEEHKILAKSNGTWTTEMVGGVGAEAFTSKGTTVNKMILGGRYQESVNTGTMMGMPFEGRGTFGYDNAKKVFVSSWVDNMGTGIMNMEGTWDEASKTITLKGKGIDPVTLKENDYREVFKMIDDNHQFMEMYGPGPDGKEAKMFEIKYTRKK